MYNPEQEAARRIMAIRHLNDHQVVIPKPVKIKNPTEWVVLEDIGIAPGGSFVRYSRGDRVGPEDAAVLLTEGAKLQPVA